MTPSGAVLRAFGAGGPARPLPGGQGTSWIAGDVVLKPEEAVAHEWLAGVMPDGGFRLAVPVRASDGGWIVDGWSATRWVEGAEPDYREVSTWQRIIAAGRAFHRAVAHLGHPVLAQPAGVRQDWWARADRVAWDEADVTWHPDFADTARRLREALEPPESPQIVHGDLTRNVLFADGLPPAIIDVSPYWRPPSYAEGVVVADALCWHDAPPALGEILGVPVAAVARALLFRMATANGRGKFGEAPRYAIAVEAIGY